MGTHGRTGVGRLVLGSVAEETIRSVGCPVLTVPPGSAEPLGTEPTAVSFSRILCPIDFSPESLAALNMAIVLAERAQGTVSVLHVVEWFDWGQRERHRFLNVPEYPQQAVEDAHARAHVARAAFRSLRSQSPGCGCRSAPVHGRAARGGGESRGPHRTGGARARCCRHVAVGIHDEPRVARNSLSGPHDARRQSVSVRLCAPFPAAGGGTGSQTTDDVNA